MNLDYGSAIDEAFGSSPVIVFWDLYCVMRKGAMPS